MHAPVVIQGDCLAVMRAMEPNSVDAIVCDPPYGLEFMGKAWDSFKTYAGGNPNMKPQGQQVEGRGDGEWKPGTSYGGRSKNPRCRGCGKLQRGNGCCKCPTPKWDTRTNEGAYQFQCFMEDWAVECWRVAKPGAHLVAFGGTRTFHRLACAIEDAGWEIRDTLSWMYGQGFPKSHNLPGGLGTALKPAWEPIILARKPLAGTVAATVSQYGTGALNIDGCRIGTDDRPARGDRVNASGSMLGANSGMATGTTTLGRWPANVCLDESAAALLDAQSGERKSMGGSRGAGGKHGAYSPIGAQPDIQPGYGDTGGASRFYYCAKSSRAERSAGLGDLAASHPTVKPLALMRWLCRLVTPPGGLILDPFTGSGSTGCAAVLEGFRFTGIEQDESYCTIARRRIAHWAPVQPDLEPAA